MPGLGIHCANPSEDFSGPPDLGVSANLMVFNADGSEFHGTELLLSAVVFEKQTGNPAGIDARPCPTEDSGEYHDLSGEGLPFYACHH